MIRHRGSTFCPWFMLDATSSSFPSQATLSHISFIFNIIHKEIDQRVCPSRCSLLEAPHLLLLVEHRQTTHTDNIETPIHPQYHAYSAAPNEDGFRIFWNEFARRYHRTFGYTDDYSFLLLTLGASSSSSSSSSPCCSPTTSSTFRIGPSL